MLTIRNRDLTFSLLILWLTAGIVTMIAGFGNVIFPVVSLVLIFPFLFLSLLLMRVIAYFLKASSTEKLMIGTLSGIWALHGFNVITPETGFDAVWYHLPIVDEMSKAHRFVFIPEMYQSVNPLFSDLLFLLGYQVAGEVGAKVIAFTLALTVITLTYQLARIWLSKSWTLGIIILISTFQVITWQASSFYVDVVKAMWELGCLWCIWLAFNKNTSAVPDIRLISVSGMLLGASLATKAFSVLLIPVMLVILILFDRKYLKSIPVLLFFTVILAAPFYWRTYEALGTPFASATIHLAKLDEIGGAVSPLVYLKQRIVGLPTSPIELFFKVRDYVSIGLFVLSPFLILKWRLLSQDKTLIALVLFSASQWFIWWFVPPLSTRYALSGFITLAIVIWVATYHWCQSQREFIKPVWLVLAVAISFNLLPRLAVFYRTLNYVREGQPKTKYLHQFYDGGIDRHLQKWHHLEK